MQETAEFQEHYAHTVVFRILYTLDRTEKGVLTLSDVKRGNLAQAMLQLDREEDINKVLRFFSYEHFYVMYCKVWCFPCLCPLETVVVSSRCMFHRMFHQEIYAGVPITADKSCSVDDYSTCSICHGTGRQ